MLLSIEATSADELRSKVLDLVKMFGTAPSDKIEAVKHTDSAPLDVAVAVSETDAPKPLKRSRKKETPTEVVSQTPEAPTETKTEVLQSFTKNDVDAALREVNSQKGMGVAKKLLNDFGCNRLSEVKEEQYPAFVAACKAAV